MKSSSTGETFQTCNTLRNQKILIIPSSKRIFSKHSRERGFVKTSANRSSVGQYISSISPFSTCSLRKWCLIWMCLVFEWRTGSFEIQIVLVLSHNMGMHSRFMWKSTSCYLIHNVWAQHAAADTYSSVIPLDRLGTLHINKHWKRYHGPRSPRK